LSAAETAAFYEQIERRVGSWIIGSRSTTIAPS
jgi:hypothetical protein